MKQTKQQAIPIHRMDAQTPLGIAFGYMEVKDELDEALLHSHKNVLHRDDYYLFLYVESAEALLTVDFEEMRVVGKTVFYVRPGQVHFASAFRGTKGWVLSMDAMLVEKVYRDTFEGHFLTQRPIALDHASVAHLEDTARLLQASMQAKQTAFSKGMILNLANMFVGLIAEQYAERQELEHGPHHSSRAAWITHQFQALLSANFKTMKSPAQYALALHYSLSHLNESVKRVSGFTVSYWIHQQVVLEAKRLLYFTQMDVREIAFALGYEDYAYFSRLFTKVMGVSPGAFRRRFHE
jgi:AraC-like DNA-binding protein